MTDTEKRLAEIRERCEKVMSYLRDGFYIGDGARLISQEESDAIAELLDGLLSEIDRLTAENAALKEAQRWIPVTERLPENGQDVWIHEAGRVYEIRWGRDWGFTPSHWMQRVVPEPPEQSKVEQP